MPDLGNTNTGASRTQNIEGSAYGLKITMPEDGTLDSISAYLWETFAANIHNVIAAIYNADASTLIAYSTCRSDISTTAGYVPFTGFGTVNLSAGVTYYICVMSNSDAGDLRLGGDDPPPDSFRDTSITAQPCTTPDSSLTISSQARYWGVYLTYSAGDTTQEITLELVTAPATAYEPTVLGDQIPINLDLVTAPATAYEPVVEPQAVTITLGLVTAPATPYEPVVRSVFEQLLDLVTAPATAYEPVVSAGPVTIALDLLVAPATAYALEISGGDIVAVEVGGGAFKGHGAVVLPSKPRPDVTIDNDEAVEVTVLVIAAIEQFYDV